jgi:hypothetical protein
MYIWRHVYTCINIYVYIGMSGNSQDFSEINSVISGNSKAAFDVAVGELYVRIYMYIYTYIYVYIYWFM